MTYLWQYQAKVEPLFTETVTPPEQIMGAIVQHPDPVREPESLTITEDFTYASYCYTSVIGGAIRNFTFPNQTIAYIATWKMKSNGPSGRQLAVIGDNPGTSLINFACIAGFDSAPDQRVIVRDNLGFTQDFVFNWVVGQIHEFRAHVNLVANTYTVYVDDTLVAEDFAFTNGLPDSNHDHWGLGGGATFEVCDFRAVPDDSATEIVPTYLQDQPLPFPPERPVDEGGTFEVIAPFDVDITVDNWHVQHPEPIQPAPLNQTGEVFFVAEPSTIETGPILLDKWFQPISEPIFLPVRLEHLSPAFMIAPLGATPVSGVVTQTLTTMLKTFVGVKGTKFKIQIRQTEGSPELTTVPDRSVLSVAFHPRSVLLVANTLVQPTGSYDAHIEAQAANLPRVFDFLRARESGIPGNSNAHICLEYDVTAFEGVIYRSVKVRMTNEEDNDVFQSTFRIVRIIQPWRLDSGDVTWNQYDRTLVSPAGDWVVAGGRGGADFSESVNWVPKFPFPVETDTVTESPDITTIVESAIKNNAGVLKLMIQKVSQTAQASNINDFHSSRAPGIADTQKPHLFFDAF